MTKPFFQSVAVYFREYCSHSSVHGIQYLGEEKRTVFERYRIWWFIIFVACLTACTFSIYAVYVKWERSPVIVNFANKGTPLYEIPFPAITICPEAKSRQDKFNFTEIMQKKEDNVSLTPLEEIHFEYMSLLCNYYPDLKYMHNETFPEDLYDFFDKAQPRFQIQNCSFMAFDFKCEFAFIKILTDEGVCYTFNMLNRDEIFRENVIHYKDYHKMKDIFDENGNYIKKNHAIDWNLENGYSDQAGIESYPFRAFLSGAKSALSFNIITQTDDLDYACRSSLQGYRVHLHAPMAIPRPSQKYFRIPLDQSVVVAVHPVMITTSETIKAYSPKRRNCYFSSEYPLKYFLNYSAENCKLECLTNYTLWNCKCVNYFMPRFNETDICGTAKLECMRDAEAVMHSIYLYNKIEEEELEELLDEKSGEFDCDCLPLCSELIYEADISQTDWNWKKLLVARRSLPRYNNSHLSSVTVFFKSDYFITSERNELYGPLDFLGNFGGLLGLFTGFSVLSLMEILYFLTIRIVCNIRLHSRWAESQK